MKYAGLLTIMGVLLAALAQAAAYSGNFTPQNTVSKIDSPQFFVTALKYDPYPVNAGDWFNLWVKVENIGEQDAMGTKFELVLSYPFSSSEGLTQEFGAIRGKKSATENKRPGEMTPQDNQIVLKYRVRVADSAPDGTQTLKLRTYIDGAPNQIYDLPISVEKTKTTIEMTAQEVSPSRTTFTVGNTGEKGATGVTITITDKSGTLVEGPAFANLGNLDVGEFTTASFKILPSDMPRSIPARISYTDVTGTRNSIDTLVSVPKIAEEDSSPSLVCSADEIGKRLNWIFALAGIGVGIILGVLGTRMVGNHK